MLIGTTMVSKVSKCDNVLTTTTATAPIVHSGSHEPLNGAGWPTIENSATVLVERENYKNKTFRDKLSTSLEFRNFKLGENGYQNHRDATVLGNPPGILIPEQLRKYHSIRLGIYLDTDYNWHDTSLAQACQVTAPVFRNQSMKTVHSEMSFNAPVEQHELWVRTDTLGAEFTIFFKKRCWNLSRVYRKVTGIQWPKFVVVATPTVKGVLVHEEAVRTHPFEVRSKEQSNKTAASRGLSVAVTKRRRTPQTEEAANRLYKIQANIIQLRAQITNEKQWSADFETRIRFMVAISQTDPSFHQLHTQMAASLTKIQNNTKQRKN